MRPIKLELNVPGSKSLLNRALLCAALAKGKSVITNPVYCDDTNYMIGSLQKLGVKITTSKTSIVVTGNSAALCAPQRPQRIFIGNAGTVRRFLTPFLPAGSLVGNKRMQQRPISELEEAVQELRSKNKVSITGAVSSQFISALLMYAPTVGKPVTITVMGKLVSAPYVQMTLQVMKSFGIKTLILNSQFSILPQIYKATHYTVEPDASSATYWWAFNSISGSNITIPNIPATTLQPDLTFQKLVKKIPGKINMKNCPDAVMSVAAVAALTPGKTIITGIEHLRGKESDRLHLLQLNLRRLGVSARATASQLIITGRSQKLWPTTIHTEHDHRMAMAFAILSLVQPGITIDDKTCVKKSYPSFWNDFKTVQHTLQHQHIILTGMRGAGKTTLAKKLAKQWHLPMIDLDQMIEQVVKEPIADYVEAHGWPAFRKIEHQVLKKVVSQKTAHIIATGGGTVMFANNRKLLAEQYIILVMAPLDVIKARLAGQTHRPSLTGKPVLKELAAVWKVRKSVYYKIADATYDSR